MTDQPAEQPEPLEEPVELDTPTEPPKFVVFRDLMRERARQVENGWTPERDDAHTLEDWAAITRERLSRADGRDMRTRLVEGAAVLIAAIESLDRRQAAEVPGE